MHILVSLVVPAIIGPAVENQMEDLGFQFLLDCFFIIIILFFILCYESSTFEQDLENVSTVTSDANAVELVARMSIPFTLMVYEELYLHMDHRFLQGCLFHKL